MPETSSVLNKTPEQAAVQMENPAQQRSFIYEEAGMVLQSYLLLRAFKAIVTVSAVLTFVFIGARLTGDPISMMFPEGLTAEDTQLYREQFGLDKPIRVQFAIYIQNVIAGDFGTSIREGRPVTVIFADAAIETLKLGIWAFLLSSIAGILIGMLTSLKPQHVLSRILMFFTCLGYSVPGFIVAIILILVFSYHLQLLPSMGMSSAKSYLLPVFALSVRPVASIARYMHAAFQDVLAQDYIRTARSKGLGERIVLLKHAFRNTLVPMSTVIGMLVIDILGGALFVEVIFSWPGLGKLLIDSVMYKDFPVLQFGVVCFSLVVIVTHLLIDILYGAIDPRIRKVG